MTHYTGLEFRASLFQLNTMIMMFALPPSSLMRKHASSSIYFPTNKQCSPHCRSARLSPYPVNFCTKIFSQCQLSTVISTNQPRFIILQSSTANHCSLINSEALTILGLTRDQGVIINTLLTGTPCFFQQTPAGMSKTYFGRLCQRVPPPMSTQSDNIILLLATANSSIGNMADRNIYHLLWHTETGTWSRPGSYVVLTEHQGGKLA